MQVFLWFPLLVAFKYVTATVECVDFGFGNLGDGEGKDRVIIHKYALNCHLNIRVLCPKPYVILPSNNEEDANTDPRVYVLSGGLLIQQRISNVIRDLAGTTNLVFNHDHANGIMSLSYPLPNLLVRRYSTDFFFLCTTPDLQLDEALSFEIWQSTVYTNFGYMYRRPINYLVDIAITKNTCLGIAGMDISHLSKVAHGCGSMPTNPFLNDVQEVEGKGRFCTIDILQHPDVGFYCDGILSPATCFVDLHKVGSTEIFTPATTAYIEYHPGEHDWTIGEYIRHIIREPFDGECRCLDRVTGAVKATIRIMTGGPAYVCDIPAQFMRNRLQPMLGNSCDVALFPGNTLTIKLPVVRAAAVEPPAANTTSVISTRGLIEFDMSPKDMQQYHVWPQSYVLPETISVVNLDESFPGGMIQVDESRRNEGEIVIRYLKNHPMSYYAGFEKVLVYIWHLYTSDTVLLPDVHGRIKVLPIQTHDYYIYGCEPHGHSNFHSYAGNESLMRKVLTIGGKDMRSCDALVEKDIKYALLCPHGQTLEPDNCESLGYNASLQGVGEWPGSISVKRNYSLANLRMFTILDNRITDGFSMSCYCTDQDGVATAKLAVQHNKNVLLSYNRLGKNEDMGLIVPTINMMALEGDASFTKEIRAIPFPDRHRGNGLVLRVGTVMIISCLNDIPVTNQIRETLNGRTKPYMVPENYMLEEELNDGTRPYIWDHSRLANYPRWLPISPTTLFYSLVVTRNGSKLVPRRYSDVLGTNSNGFRIVLRRLVRFGDPYNNLKIINPRSAIIVSKTNRKYVHLIYACGQLSGPYLENDSSNGLDDEAQGSHEGTGTSTAHGSSAINLDGYPLADEIRPDVVAPDSAVLSGQAATTDAGDAMYARLPADYSDIGETRSLHVWGRVDILVPSTDPYLHGCGIVDETEELFRPDTTPLHDHLGQPIGCEVNLAVQKQASFYCPLPYHTEPHDCAANPPLVGIELTVPNDAANSHFYVFTSTRRGVMAGQKLQGLEPAAFECHCVTQKGVKVSTIRITNSRIAATTEA